MLRYEWKKMLFRRGGWILILVLLVVELGSLVLFTTPYDQELEKNREVYDRYLSQVEGALDADKRAYLEAEMTRLTLLHQQMEQAKQDYFRGEITEEEYREQFNELLPEDQNYTGFTKLYSQYIFVRESEERSFLYTGGWELLFTDWEPDYLFLLVLVILLAPVFCEEYACKMQEMLLTQRKSARRMAPTKVAACLLLTAGLTAILQGFELVYMAVRFGLPDWGFHLRSLMTFGTARWDLTLWQAFLLQFALKEIGYLYAAVGILFLSVLLKKYALTLMAGIVLLPLPFLTVGEVKPFLTLPGPWALTVGSIYLASDQSITGLLLISAAIILGMLWFIARRNTNYQLKGRKGRKAAAVAALGCVLLLTGCSEAEGPSIYYNNSDSQRYETDRYLLETNSFGDATITDKTTGEVLPLPLDALEVSTVGCGSSLFGVGDTVYYKKTIRTSKNLDPDYATEDSYDVFVKLDLNTLEETVLYQWNIDTDWFFGQLQRPSWENYYASPIFVHGNRLYCIFNTELGYIDMTTGAYTTMYESISSLSLAYDGENIYYVDEYSRLTIENLDTGEITSVDEVVAYRFLLTPEGLFFLNLRDNDTLYHWDAQTGAVEKRSDISGYSLVRRSDGLWLRDTELNEYCLNFDGTEKTES